MIWGKMNADAPNHDPLLPLAMQRQIGEICDRFEAALKAGDLPSIERSLADVGEPARSPLLRWLLLLELDYRRRSGQTPTPEEYQVRFPDHTTIVAEVLKWPK